MHVRVCCRMLCNVCHVGCIDTWCGLLFVSVGYGVCVLQYDLVLYGDIIVLCCGRCCAAVLHDVAVDCVL